MRSWGEFNVTTLTGVVGWLLPVAAILALALVLRRERHHARRLADRSAELERLSAELLHVNRMKSEFLANVSHELRTPLNAIVGFVDLLRDGVYGELGARQVKPVERIEASATHLRHLVDQILDLAKMASGRLEVHAEPIDVRPFLLDITSEVEPLAGDSGLSLSIDVAGAVPKIRTDPLHLRQILMNLIGNAIKYTDSGGVIVRTRTATEEEGAASPSRRMLGISVIDTGIGIRPSDHERIFEEFEQVNAGPRSESHRRGTGLGLAISRRLAQALGGSIQLESELGRGSTFTLWLPAESDSASSSEQSLELVEHAGLLDV